MTEGPIAIVQECNSQDCEFFGGIARVECIEAGHSVGVDYVRRSHTGTLTDGNDVS